MYFDSHWKASQSPRKLECSYLFEQTFPFIFLSWLSLLTKRVSLRWGGHHNLFYVQFPKGNLGHGSPSGLINIELLHVFAGYIPDTVFPACQPSFPSQGKLEAATGLQTVLITLANSKKLRFSERQLLHLTLVMQSGD